MTIIKIEPYENGAHDNNTIHGADPETFPVPEGYAVVPEGVEIPDTFPFVDIEVDESQTPPVVTSMTAGVVPEPEPESYTPTTEDRLAAVESAMLTMMMGG